MTNTIRLFIESLLTLAASGCVMILIFMSAIGGIVQFKRYLEDKRQTQSTDYADISDEYYYGKQSKLEPEEWMNYTE